MFTTRNLFLLCAFDSILKTESALFAVPRRLFNPAVRRENANPKYEPYCFHVGCVSTCESNISNQDRLNTPAGKKKFGYLFLNYNDADRIP
jgi:hypothetical protein